MKLLLCSYECQGRILESRRAHTNQMPHTRTPGLHPMRKDLPNPGILDLNPDPNLPTDVPHGVTLAPDHGHDLTPEDTSGVYI